MSKTKNNTVTLDEPIKRGDKLVTEVEVRKPTAGELRGASLYELMQLNTDAMIKVLPRITIPALQEAELKQLSPADLVQLATEVVGFLVPSKAKEEA